MNPIALHRDMAQRIRALTRRAPQTRREVKWGSPFTAYGIYTEPLRALLSEYHAALRALPLAARLQLASRLLRDRIAEHGHAAVEILRISADELTPDNFPALDALLDQFFSWGVTDDFCSAVMPGLLKKYPDQAVQLCRFWSKATNPWKRRAALVTFTRKAGASGKFTRAVLDMSETLLWDEEKLVQQAVGWALKDNLRGNKKEVTAYVRKLRRRGVPSTITLYAVRGLRGAERAQILKVKKLSSPRGKP